MARGRPSAHPFPDLPVSAVGAAPCRTMRSVALGLTGVRGGREALLLAAVLLAASHPPALHALQPPQPPSEAAAEPSAQEQPAEADVQQSDAEQAAESDAETPAETDAEAAVESGDETPAGDEEAEQPAGTFEAPAGLILSYIKSDGRADFERVMLRLGEALADSEEEERRELLAGWRLYRAVEPGPEGEVLYVWLVDPAVAGADYAMPALLGEALPDESQELFDAFSDVFGSGQALINLEPVDLVPAAPE